MNWNQEVIEPNRRSTNDSMKTPGRYRHASPPLIRFSFSLAFLIAGLGTWRLGQWLLGLPEGIWNVPTWDAKTVCLLVVSLVAAMIGGVVGMGLGIAIQVKNERVNETLIVLWQHLATGLVLWSLLLAMVLTKVYGKARMQEFAHQASAAFWWETFAIAAGGALCIGLVTVLWDLLKRDVKSGILSRVLLAAPIGLLMGHLQTSLLPGQPSHWIFLGIAFPMTLVPAAGFFVNRDRRQRRQILDQPLDANSHPSAIDAAHARAQEGREYKPTLASFVGSSLYSLSPAVAASAAVYFLRENFGTVMWIATGLMILVSIGMFLSSVFVHLSRIYVDEQIVRVSSPLSTSVMRWSEVASAVLRQRVNAVSRTDQMVMLQSPRAVVILQISTLSSADANRVLSIVRRKTRLVEQNDRAAV